MYVMTNIVCMIYIIINITARIETEIVFDLKMRVLKHTISQNSRQTFDEMIAVAFPSLD